MITVTIKEQAQKRGITTAYQLQKLTGVQPSVAAKWYKNELKMIGMDSLDRLCATLRCKPNDLFKFEADGE